VCQTREDKIKKTKHKKLAFFWTSSYQKSGIPTPKNWRQIRQNAA
jgi:hypothetical protein